MINLKSFAVAAVMAGVLTGCAAHNPKMWEPAKAPKATPVTTKLNALPPSGQRAAVAVYNFTDQTGQFKQTDGAQTLSRAVTQGATSILVKTLHEAGNRSWFTVVERERLENLLRERAVIREMRSSYLGETKINPQALPPLLFAGVLLEGGIIGYDSNTKTGGSGARLLGIGGRTQYREDTVTVYLRAVSVKTGEVLASVSSRKSIASVAVGADAFRFVAFRELLELEAGVTYNEPDELALRQAIEASVYSLIMEGAMQDLWCFNAPDQEVTRLLTEYVSDRDSIPDSIVNLPTANNGGSVIGACSTQKVARQSIEQARQATPAAPNTQSGQRPRAVTAPSRQTTQSPARGVQQPARPQNAAPQATLQKMSGTALSAVEAHARNLLQPDTSPAVVRVPLRRNTQSPAPAPTLTLAKAAPRDVMSPDIHSLNSASFAQWNNSGAAQCVVNGLDTIAASDLMAELARRVVNTGSTWVGGAEALNHFALAGLDRDTSGPIVRVSLQRDGTKTTALMSGRAIRDIAVTSVDDENTTQNQPLTAAAHALGGWVNSIFQGERETIRIELHRS
ncbi:MAG: CsgG/HfaB family protein [Pseudomonadota bacterium]